MADAAEAPARTSLYETDFYAWTQEQARLLRAGRWSDLDLDNLVDEVEGVGGSDKREIENRLVVLIAHLLKWKYRPYWRSPGWEGTVAEQRRRIKTIVKNSPSLQRYPAEVFADQYLGARLRAAKETGIDFTLFPEDCPFTAEQALDDAFMPREPDRYDRGNEP